MRHAMKQSISIIVLSTFVLFVLGLVAIPRLGRAAAPMSGGTIYYISPNGDNTNPGTSMDAPLQTIQRGVELAQPGETITLASGVYQQDVVTQRNGAEAAPITITGPADAIVQGSGNSHIVTINHSYIVLHGFTIDGQYQEGSYRDTLVYVLGKQAQSSLPGVKLLGLTLRDAGSACVRLRYFVQGAEIANNSIQNCGHHDFPNGAWGGNGKNGEGVYIGTAIEQRADGENPTSDPDQSNNNWVHHNTINIQANACVAIREGASGNIVEHNSCVGQREPESGGFDIRGNDNVLRYNEAIGNEGVGIRLGGDTADDGINNSVIANTIRDNQAGGVDLRSNPQANICGNTMSGNTNDVVGTNTGTLDPAHPCDVMSETAVATDVSGETTTAATAETSMPLATETAAATATTTAAAAEASTAIATATEVTSLVDSGVTTSALTDTTRISTSVQQQIYLPLVGKAGDSTSVDTSGTGLAITEIKGAQSGGTISGKVVIEAVVSGKDISKVSFQLNGPATLTHTESGKPYYFMGDTGSTPHVWDTTQVPDGSYTLTVTAYSSSGSTASTHVGFQVRNTTVAALPTLVLKGIQSGQIVGGNVAIEAVINGGSVSKVVFQLNGPVTKEYSESSPPYYFLGDQKGTPSGWDTTQVPDGSYALTVTAYNNSGSIGSASVNFRVGNSAPPPGTSDGAVYYVSPSGSNGDGRSWATAWNELDRINWRVIQPGSTILLDGGSPSITYRTTLTIGASGTASAPIRILRATDPGHNGQVLIDGGRAAPLPYCSQSSASWSPPSSAVRTSGVEIAQQWVLLDGRTWRGIKLYRHALSGLRFWPGASNITVRNLDITDNGTASLMSSGGWTTDGSGIRLTGTNITVERAIIYDNGQDAVQSAGTNPGIANFTVRQSWFYNSAHPVFGDKWARNSHQDGASCTHADGIQIYNGGAQHGLLVEDSVFGPRLMQALILGDTCSTCNNSSMSNVTIRNSVLHNSTAQALMMKGAGGTTPTQWRIEQSTVYVAGGNNLIIRYGTGHVFKDSLFVNGNVNMQAAATLSGNCQWHTTGTTLGSTADPQFADPLGGGNRERADFTLGAGSPCAGKGSTITSAQQLLSWPNQ